MIIHPVDQLKCSRCLVQKRGRRILHKPVLLIFRDIKPCCRSLRIALARRGRSAHEIRKTKELRRLRAQILQVKIGAPRAKLDLCINVATEQAIVTASQYSAIYRWCFSVSIRTPRRPARWLFGRPRSGILQRAVRQRGDRESCATSTSRIGT